MGFASILFLTILLILYFSDFFYYNEVPIFPVRDLSGREKFPCPSCSSLFTRKDNLQNHLKYECGQPARFNCPYCPYRTKNSSNVRAHVRRIHPGREVYVVDVAKTHLIQMPNI